MSDSNKAVGPSYAFMQAMTNNPNNKKEIFIS
jgi:hypothetical protein